MDSFSSPSSSGNPNPEVVMEQIKAQLAQAYAQEFLEVTHKDEEGQAMLTQQVPDSQLEYQNSFEEALNLLGAASLVVTEQTVGSKCFEKCVTKPGSSLSGSESSCISRCVDRYIEATGIISRALFSTPR